MFIKFNKLGRLKDLKVLYHLYSLGISSVSIDAFASGSESSIIIINLIYSEHRGYEPHTSD